ncbi:MAG TPA: ATP-binding protein [bacterium]|nr:ATP-binding protein [bacterium]
MTGATPSDVVGDAEEKLLHVAFQIHNGPAQCLATALALFRAMDRQLPPEMAEARESLRATIASTQTALESTRRAIGALRSPASSPLTGPGALATYLRDGFEEVRAHTQAELSLDIEPVDDLPSGIVTGLAEVGREALVNAARHAAARHIWVSLQRARRAVVLEVKDDGRGFEGAGERRRQGGFGLALMHDQMRLLGGTLSIRRVPAEGTVVRASIPLAEGASVPGRRVRRSATA